MTSMAASEPRKTTGVNEETEKRGRGDRDEDDIEHGRLHWWRLPNSAGARKVSMRKDGRMHKESIKARRERASLGRGPADPHRCTDISGKLVAGARITRGESQKEKGPVSGSSHFEALVAGARVTRGDAENSASTSDNGKTPPKRGFHGSEALVAGTRTTRQLHIAWDIVAPTP